MYILSILTEGHHKTINKMDFTLVTLDPSKKETSVILTMT